MEGTRSLVGHEDELALKRWKEDNTAYQLFYRSRTRISAFLITLTSILLTILVIFFLQWHAGSENPISEGTGDFDSLLVPRPERDLKILLHPEEHVSRDPNNRRFSWNITKATIAPNGVQKDVFLINGTIYSYCMLFFIGNYSRQQVNILVRRSKLVQATLLKSRYSIFLRRRYRSTGMGYT